MDGIMQTKKRNVYRVAGWKGWRGQITINKVRKYWYGAEMTREQAELACGAWAENELLKTKKNISGGRSWLFFRQKWNEYARTRKHPLSQRTINEYNYAFDRVEKYIKPVFLSDITLFKLRGMVSDLEDEARENGQDNYGVNKVIQCMRVSLKWAMNKGYLEDFPIDNLELLDVDPVEVKTNEIREVEMMLKYGTPKERAVVLFGFDCSLRPEEISNLLWEKLDLENGFGWISENKCGWGPKCAKPRQFRITERLKEELMKLPRVCDYVITNQYGRGYTSGGFCKFFREFRERVNEEIEKNEPEKIKITGTCKTLRKNYSTYRQSQGAEEKAVSKSMGHADTKVTKQHYTNEQQTELRCRREEEERKNLLDLDKFIMPLNYK
jgi:integrase